MLAGIAAILGRVVMLGAERIVVKRLGTRHRAVSAAFLFFAFATVLLAPALAFVRPPRDLHFLGPLAVNSLVYSGAFLLYVRALALGEASVVSPLYNFNVFFLLLLAVVLLSETFSLWKITGMVLLVAGAWFLNRSSGDLDAVRSNARGSALMIACSFCMAIGRTVDAAFVQGVPAVYYSFLIYAGITVILLVVVVASGSQADVAAILRSSPLAAIGAGALNAYSYVLLLVAMQHLEVSVAEPISIASALVTLALARLVLKEKIGARIVPTLALVGGAVLLFF